MKLSLQDSLSTIIIFQLLFLSSFLFTNRKGKKISNILLGSFFISLCFNFTDGILIHSKAYSEYPHFAFIGNNFTLLFGPLLYLYTRSVIYKNFKLSKKTIWHILPFIFFLTFSILTFHVQPYSMKLYILNEAGNRQNPLILYALSIFIYSQLFIYAFASLFMIKRYRKELNNLFSDIQNLNLNWLSSTIIFFIIMVAIAMVSSYITLTPFTKYFDYVFIILIVTIFIFINRIAFNALKQPKIFWGLDETEGEQILNTSAETKIKYSSSILTVEEKETIKNDLLNFMETNKPFLQPELTLDELANCLKLKPKILSQVINELINRNFFDFINRYRIEEARLLLTNPKDKKITILEVMYKVGFNSKSSFNTLFKKYVGVTPSDYKSRYLS